MRKKIDTLKLKYQLIETFYFSIDLSYLTIKVENKFAK